MEMTIDDDDEEQNDNKDEEEEEEADDEDDDDDDDDAAAADDDDDFHNDACSPCSLRNTLVLYGCDSCANLVVLEIPYSCLEFR